MREWVRVVVRTSPIAALLLVSFGSLAGCGVTGSGYREVSLTQLDNGANVEMVNALRQRRSIVVGSGGFTVYGGSLAKARLYRDMRFVEYAECRDGFGRLSIDIAGESEDLGRIRPTTWAAIEEIIRTYSVRTVNRCEGTADAASVR